MKRLHHNSPAHAPHNETRNSCSHCADIPVLVPSFINTTATKGNILCRPLGWQERGIQVPRCCDANSWSHVGEQNALQISLQGKKRGTSKHDERVFLSSKSRQPSESRTPSSCPAPARTQFEAMSKGETHPSVAAVFLTGAASQFPSFGPRRKEGEVEERQSRVQKIIRESMKSFDSNVRADPKTFLLLSPCVAPLSASFQHFPAKMILMVQSVAEGTATFHAGACQIRAAHQLWLSSLVTQCPSIYF